MGMVFENYARDFQAAGQRLAGVLAAKSAAVMDERDAEGCYALGVTYSTAAGTMRDLIEAHKWFNLAALRGHEESSWCRAEIAEEMSRDEVAEAQRRARQWLGGEARRAA